jgi:hypothetical protein
VTEPSGTGRPTHRVARRGGFGRLRRSRYALVLVLATALVSVPGARAGGDFVDLAVGGGRVWFVGPPGVRALDARSGRTLSTPMLRGAAYPLSVTIAGGAAWVASVENGYVWGTLSRIDARTGQVRVVWRKEGSSVQYVAAGAGGVWALIGSRRGARIALFALSGRLARVWRIAAAGRLAADQHGCWVATGKWLLQINPAGPVRRVVRAPLGDVTTGDGAVWLPRETSVLRIDERTGRQRTLRTGRLRLGGFQHDLAAGNGALWALQSQTRSRSTLLRLDARSGRITGHTSLRGIAAALVLQPHALWAATVIAPPPGPATGFDVIRIDPRTLRRTLVIHVS